MDVRFIAGVATEHVLAIDTTSNQSDQFSINSADINASDVTFKISTFLGTIKLKSENLKASAFTTIPPGIVTPSTGSSTISVGSTGAIMITPSGPSTFYRIKAVESKIRTGKLPTGLRLLGDRNSLNQPPPATG